MAAALQGLLGQAVQDSCLSTHCPNPFVGLVVPALMALSSVGSYCLGLHTPAAMSTGNPSPTSTHIPYQIAGVLCQTQSITAYSATLVNKDNMGRANTAPTRPILSLLQQSSRDICQACDRQKISIAEHSAISPAINQFGVKGVQFIPPGKAFSGRVLLLAHHPHGAA